MTEGPAGAQLRPLTADDLAPVLAIEQASQPTPWSCGNFRDCLRGTYRCRVATVCDQPVAFMILSRVLDEAHLLNISVAPAWRRSGLARWMLLREFDDAIAAGQAVMHLEVRAGNRAARRLYESLAFADCGLRKAYYRTADGGHEDAILMSMDLAAYR